MLPDYCMVAFGSSSPPRIRVFPSPPRGFAYAVPENLFFSFALISLIVFQYLFSCHSITIWYPRLWRFYREANFWASESIWGVSVVPSELPPTGRSLLDATQKISPRKISSASSCAKSKFSDL